MIASQFHFHWLLGDSVQKELRNYNEAKALTTSAVGLPAGHVRRFSRAFAAKVHYFTANSWNCAAAQHHGQDHAFDNLCAQLLDTHLARCSSHHGLCDLHGAYPVQIRYNKKDEEIQATFSLEAVNDVTGAIVLRRIQQLL